MSSINLGYTEHVCKKCGEKVLIEEFRYPIKDDEGGQINCPKCNEIVLKWSKGIYDYFLITEEDLIARKKAYEERLSWPDCPKCEGKLIKRRSEYGEFYGCTNYPKCTYKKRIK